MSRRERLHRIWIALEFLFVFWRYLSEDDQLIILSRALEEARNGEQVQILRDATGLTDLLHQTLVLLQQVQAGESNTEAIDALTSDIREILDNGLETGRERQSSGETTIG